MYGTSILFPLRKPPSKSIYVGSYMVAEYPDSHFHYEVIPFLRTTSSVNVGFLAILLGRLELENDLTAS
jgi:hypothetical protein